MAKYLSPASIPSRLSIANYDGVLVRKTRDVVSNSVFLDSQLPEFVRDDHPKFVEFMKSYYDWLSIKGNVDYATRKFKDELDIDTASEKYEDVLHKEFLSIIPKDLKTHKNQVLKYARQFYRAKGVEKSFKLFFRMLYDASVEFYYPRKDILKASDGKWIQNKSLRVIEDITRRGKQNFINKVITGQSSKATAFVDRTVSVRSRSSVSKELFLNIYSITGKFLPNEIVTTEDGASARISPVISKIEFVNDNNKRSQTGTGYEVGDNFLIDYGAGNKAKIKVASITEGGAIRRFSIKDFSVECPDGNIYDIDYRTSDKEFKYFVSPSKANIQYKIEGVDVDVAMTNFKNQEDLELTNKFFVEGSFVKIKGKDDVNNSRDLLFVIESVQSYGDSVVNLALKFDKFEGDTTLPSSMIIERIESISGKGAKIKVSSGALCEYPGYYLGNYGQLSEGKYIQDNLFYQQFSYVLYSNTSLDTYRESLLSILHPLGMKIFAGFRDPTNVSAKIRTNRNSSFRRRFDKFSRPKFLPYNSNVGRPSADESYRFEDLQYAPVSMKTKARVFVKLHKENMDTLSSVLGPSNRSIFRDRFKYLPTKDTPSIFELSNNSESSPTKIFTTPPNSLPTANSSVDWLDSFDDSEINISYNTGTANGYWNGSSTKDNKLYWGTPGQTVDRYANMQIYHFLSTIPKSLDGFGVPDFVMYKSNAMGNTILLDNRDYVIQFGPNEELKYLGKKWKITLKDSVQFESGDQILVAFKDQYGKIVVHKQEFPDDRVIWLPRTVRIKAPRTKINIVPEAIITRGV